MGSTRSTSIRCLPNGTPLQNRLLAALTQALYARVAKDLRLIDQRCWLWLLQTHDRVVGDEFLLKHEFLAIMLGTNRPTVSLVMGGLQKAGLLTSKYGRIRILDRKRLERASCECYAAILGQFKRLGL